MKSIIKLSNYINSIYVSKAIKNFSWLFFERLVRIVCGFFVTVLVARYLGAESYGQLSYGLAYTALLQAISNLGVDSLVVRDMARDKVNSSKILINVIKLKLTSSVLSLLIGVLFAFVFIEDSLITILIITLSIIFTIGNVVDLYFQSQSASRLTVIAKLKSYLIGIVIKLFVIFGSLKSIIIFILVPLEALIASFFLFQRFLKYNYKEKIKVGYFDKKYILLLLSESWPLAISSVSIIIFMKAGMFFIEDKLGFNSLGIYSVGVNLAEMFYMIPTLLLTSFAPIIAKAKSKSEIDYNNEIRSFFKLMYIGSVACVFSVGLLGYMAIPYIYGAEYSQSKYIFIIHILTLIPVAMGCAQSAWLVNERRTRIALYQTISAALLTIFLNIVFIDKHGIIGVAFATLIAQIFQSLLINFFLCRPLFILTWKTIFFR